MSCIIFKLLDTVLKIELPTLILRIYLPQRTIKLVVYIGLLITPALCVLAIGFSFLSDRAPWLPILLFYSILIVSALVRLCLYIGLSECTA